VLGPNALPAQHSPCREVFVPAMTGPEPASRSRIRLCDERPWENWSFRAGWRVAWTPHAELTHFEPPEDFRETAGENAVRLAREVRYLHTRWASVLARDPAYNPNLSLAHETCPLAWPPRATYR
jgi:hypothetical protein